MDITEIAKLAGVSIATVSRALNGRGSVRADTRRKILSIAEEHNYRPNPIARSLSQKKTDTIGVILPELVDEFFTELIRGIDEEAYRSNRFIMVSSSHGERDVVETLLEFMGSGRVAGVVLMAPSLREEVIAIASSSKCPLVVLNNTFARGKLDTFNINNYQGAFAVVEHLVLHGYERIGMLKGPEGNCDAEERWRGFQEALQKHDHRVEKNWVISGNFSIKSGYYGFMRLMSLPEKPQAIFAANDMMAVGIYEAARNSGIRIPEDIAVAGFDDILLSRLLVPRLTTVHVPVVELGMKATRHLVHVLEGEGEQSTQYFEELSTGLVVGGSCGCQNAGRQTVL